MEKKIRTLFRIRIILWVIALVASFYWIYWSFKLYDIGIFDEYEYAKYFRPIFAISLLISLVSVCISLILRRISDNIKKKMEMEKYDL